MMDKDAIVMEEKEYMEYIQNSCKNSSETPMPIAQMSLYDLNKDLVKQTLKRMNNTKIDNALQKVKDWFDPNHKFYAFLNHEQHYFTIFNRKDYTQDAAESFITQLKDILTNHYGDNDIRSITVDFDAVEIWAMWEGEPTVGYVFAYDEGVVDY